MSESENMSIDERRKYLHKMRLRYWQTNSKKERSRLLDEMVVVTGMHRKSILRLIHGELARKPRRKQRGCTYGEDVGHVVEVIAKSLDYPCAERLRPNLVWMAAHLVRHGELAPIDEEVVQKLKQISVPTLRRLQKKHSQMSTRLAFGERRRASPNPLLQGVLMRRIAWDEVQPGHLEIDLVHHCGTSPSGQYVHTIQMVDVATGWSECMAVLGRSYVVVKDAFERMVSRLPFEIQELHPDNGSEFFNAHLLRFWGKNFPGMQLSRSRPYHKNDNRFIEENNHSLVRAYLGYDRFDTVAHTHLINQLHEKLWLYHNLFQPVMRLQKKIPNPNAKERIKRIYDDAMPPFDRLCAHAALLLHDQAQLAALRNATNPCLLRSQIELLIQQLHSLPSADEGALEDVRLTLSTPQVIG